MAKPQNPDAPVASVTPSEAQLLGVLLGAVDALAWCASAEEGF
jgi:hypothetical protein